MTLLEVLMQILAGGAYVPRIKPDPGPDRAEGYAWVLGLVVLVAVVLYVVIALLRGQPGITSS